MKKILQRLLLLAATVLLLACTSMPDGGGAAGATGPLIDHGFSFDVQSDSPGHVLLDYRYGDSNTPVTAPPDWMRASGSMRQQGGVYGAMRLGKDIYVKWRVTATDQVYERNIDLTGRLPKNMSGHEIKFIIKNDIVYVYLISPEKRPPEWPRYDPSPGWLSYKAYVVYPNNNVQSLN